MTLRFRLTLVSTIVLMVVLTLFGAGVYVLLNRTLHENLDRQLADYAGAVARDLQLAGPETYTGRPDFIAQIVSSGGQVLTIRPFTGPGLLPVEGRTLSVARGVVSHYYRDIDVGRAQFRMLVARLQTTSAEGALMVAAPRSTITHALRRLRFLLAWAGVIGIAVAAMLAWQAAKTALRPVEEVADAAGEIGRTADLSRRVDPGGEDELGKLTTAFNGMLDRLEHAHRELERTVEGQRRFLADASHELRTPLTTMRGNLEVLRSSPSMPARDREEALRDSIEEAERMSSLVEDLLALARSDARAQHPVGEVALGAVVRDAVALATSADQAAGGDGPAVSLDDGDDDVIVRGSEEMLRRLATNLVENAIKYTPADGSVTVTVAREAGWGLLRVADTGIGMSPQEIEHAFDRFWRSDRSRGERGSGLGLAIAKSVAEEHGGAIAAESEPGRGTTMTVRLPLAPSASRATDAGPGDAGPSDGGGAGRDGQGEIGRGLTEGLAQSGNT